MLCLCSGAKVISVCRPVIKLLRLVDSGKAVMGKVYHEVFLVQEHFEGLKGMPPERKEEVVGIFVARWNQGFSKMHGAGYGLDPEYRNHDFPQEVWLDVLRVSCT